MIFAKKSTVSNKMGLPILSDVVSAKIVNVRLTVALHSRDRFRGNYLD